MLQLLKFSAITYYDIYSEINHIPGEEQIILKIRINFPLLIFVFEPVKLNKEHRMFWKEEKTNVKYCVQKDSWIKTRQTYMETVEPVSSADWTEDLRVR